MGVKERVELEDKKIPVCRKDYTKDMKEYVNTRVRNHQSASFQPKEQID